MKPYIGSIDFEKLCYYRSLIPYLPPPKSAWLRHKCVPNNIAIRNLFPNVLQIDRDIVQMYVCTIKLKWNLKRLWPNFHKFSGKKEKLP